MIVAREHPVDYAWWSTHAREGDHCLRGSLRGAEVRAASGRVLDFLRGLEQHPAWVDGVARTVAVEGGLRAYAVLPSADPAADPTADPTADAGAGATDESGLELYLHSSGEDATDTLCHYSREVAAIVRRAGGDGRLTWHQLPADRPDHQLRF